MDTSCDSHSYPGFLDRKEYRTLEAALNLEHGLLGQDVEMIHDSRRGIIWGEVATSFSFEVKPGQTLSQAIIGGLRKMIHRVEMFEQYAATHEVTDDEDDDEDEDETEAALLEGATA